MTNPSTPQPSTAALVKKLRSFIPDASFASDALDELASALAAAEARERHVDAAFKEVDHIRQTLEHRTLVMGAAVQRGDAFEAQWHKVAEQLAARTQELADLREALTALSVVWRRRATEQRKRVQDGRAFNQALISSMADVNLDCAEELESALAASPVLPSPEGPEVPRFDFHAHLVRQREWSERTFGPGTRTAGVIDHIRKELREIEAEPNDLREWMDVVILALDGAWRAGFDPDEIIDTLVTKQARNEARQWPDWRTAPLDKAIEHVREDQ